MKIYIAIVSLLFFTPLLAQEDWKLKKDKDDIKIYTKSIDSSKIKAYKVQMTVKSSLNTVKEIILDGDQLHNWNYKAIDSKLLSKSSENKHLVWMALDLPWPLRNRDVVILLTTRRITKDALRIDIMAASDAYPILDDYLRITYFEGYWLLEQKDDMVKITHQMHGDPSGNLPSWFVNSTITRAPYYNFLALKEKVQ
ncbi:START domain-containing protein [Kordia algicida OT-1]|uniref:Protein containing StAR-related lipid-transfer (START) domain n=1 Tax=Kordia algicida OT-1 TaxID=391587 RepID=A9DS70_9FLAO|nr:START domain-containing protein [Kordia algicida]EDP96893.1 protein containing StAR-related lipid-transfer (START) domain [Kordia algicida OT-1]